MRPASFADGVIAAVQAKDGHVLAQLFAIGGPFATAVMMELGDPRPNSILVALRRCSGFLAAPWEEMCQQHLLSVYYFSLASSLSVQPVGAVDAEGKTRSDRLAQAFDAYNAAVTAFLRFFATLVPGRWAVPLLRILCLNLRWLAVQADLAAAAAQSDDDAARTSSLANKRLEECARQLNKAFTACIADRNPDVPDSRKWGTYEVVGMVFKTYFRLKSIALCRNILRAISAAALPPLDEFPKSQQVTVRYYVGVLAFLGEEYGKAATELEFAFAHCHRAADHNRAMILTHLVPVKLLNGAVPAPELLQAFPKVNALYAPFLQAFRQGDVRAYDQALANPVLEKALVRRGTFIAMEKAREACLRTLFRKVWHLKQSPTRLPIPALETATTSLGLEYSAQEVEWFVANLIYKGYIKGYIAHERGILVLSANTPFPKLGSFVLPAT